MGGQVNGSYGSGLSVFRTKGSRGVAGWGGGSGGPITHDGFSVPPKSAGSADCVLPTLAKITPSLSPSAAGRRAGTE